MSRHSVRRLNHFGSIIFGAILFGIGFAIKRFVVDAGIMRGADEATMGKAAIGIMIVGGLICIGNIVFAIVCVLLARRQ